MSHGKLNRILSTIALVLGIIIMLATIIGGVAFVVKVNQVSDAFSEVGDSIEETPVEDYETPVEEFPYSDPNFGEPLPEEAGCDYEGGPDCPVGD